MATAKPVRDTKVTQQKEKDFDVVKPSVGFTDMADDMQE